MHTPVLLKEVIEALDIQPEKRYIDATFGQGGHTQAILAKGGQVLALDQDERQITNYQGASENKQDKNLRLVNGNFRDIEKIAKENNYVPVDGILFDLGLSMEQLSKSGKGLSYKYLDEPLDMRMEKGLEKTAEDIITSYSEDELYEVLAHNAEEIHSRQFARNLVRASNIKKSWTVGDLVEVVRLSIANCTLKDRHELDKSLARVFQAFRIEVNNEFGNLRLGLEGASNIISEEGKIGVITFHSLEDRIVKQFVRHHNLQEKKLVKGTTRFERSAKLRVFSLK